MRVSIVDAIGSGSLGPLAIGVSRQAVGDRLGTPTDATLTNRDRSSCMWRYGSIEFHFADDLLVRIYCDADNLFDGGSTLIVDPWKLRRNMPLDELRMIFDAKKRRYTGCDDRFAPDCVVRLDSGFSLRFVLDSDAGLGRSGLTSWSINQDA